MPRPVDALPCGSRSITSTRSPIAARAVPRLIAVVVLPTPPFWLAMASVRGLSPGPVTGLTLRFYSQIPDDHNARLVIREARGALELKTEFFSRCFEFYLRFATFRKQGHGRGRKKRQREPQ